MGLAWVLPPPPSRQLHTAVLFVNLIVFVNLTRLAFTRRGCWGATRSDDPLFPKS